jgi:hypothetical protein
MLSDAEQHRLTQIESHLRSEDPAFVQRFDGRARPRLRPGRRNLLALVAVIVAVTVVGVGLYVSSVPTVVVALTALGGVVGLWITGRQQR